MPLLPPTVRKANFHAQNPARLTCSGPKEAAFSLFCLGNWWIPIKEYTKCSSVEFTHIWSSSHTFGPEGNQWTKEAEVQDKMSTAGNSSWQQWGYLKPESEIHLLANLKVHFCLEGSSCDSFKTLAYKVLDTVWYLQPKDNLVDSPCPSSPLCLHTVAHPLTVSKFLSHCHAPRVLLSLSVFAC